MNEIRHVAIYLRLSRDEQQKGIEEMLANHRSTLAKLCKQNNWSYEMFEEIASSKTIEKREKMVELLERIKQFEFDAVLVMDIDRLSRDEYGSAKIKKIMFSNGIYIVTPTKTYDPFKDEDALLLGIQSLVAAQEYKQILKRMQRGKLYRSQQGEWMNGIPPLGYTKHAKTKKLVPNEHADTIRFIYNSIVTGKTVSDVFQELNTMGIKTRTGSKFHFNAILRIVNNECYKGTIINNRVIGKHDGERPKSDWIYVENAHSAIIDEDTWHKAVKIVNTYKFSKPKSKNRIYPTTKLIFCGNCGKVQGCQYVPHMKKLYLKICRYCKNWAYLYEPILREIKDELSNHRQTVLDTIVAVKSDSDNSDIEYKIKHIEAQIRKANKALDNIEILFEESEIDLKQYRERKAKRKAQIEGLNQELEELKAITPKDTLKSLSEVLEQVDYLLENWEMLDGKGLTDEQVNRALHMIVDRIEWKYDFNGEPPVLKIKYKK
ncbi:recombinase family protein [Rossellomorea marisflavi]|uniref:recombinase family protein n=1 Tax=Rossellomorea marisflavi TaxID=189381 RepID=UPI0039BF5655